MTACNHKWFASQRVKNKDCNLINRINLVNYALLYKCEMQSDVQDLNFRAYLMLSFKTNPQGTDSHQLFPALLRFSVFSGQICTPGDRLLSYLDRRRLVNIVRVLIIISLMEIVK